MDGMNLQASLHNLTQMDKIQSDGHRLPTTNQVQNMAMAQNEATQKLERPEDPEQAQEKSVDSEARKKTFFENRKRQKKKKQNRRRGKAGGGRFVDVTV